MFVSALIVVPAISLSAMGEDVAALLPAYAIALALLVIAVCPTTPLRAERGCAAPRSGSCSARSPSRAVSRRPEVRCVSRWKLRSK